MAQPFKLEQVLAVADRHPFYSPIHEYPLTPESVAKLVSDGPNHDAVDPVRSLSGFPITQKENLYKVMTRLYADENEQNTFRRSTYISTTGGGSGVGTPLAFLTDIRENRAQRAAAGHLLRQLNILDENDCVLSMHTSGKLYRALDLTTEIVEGAGASALPAGHLATPEKLMSICNDFRPTVLSGDASQLVHFASYVKTAGLQNSLRIRKVLYTSEPITRLQKTYLESVFGDEGHALQISSMLGSAEMGAWAASNFSITGPPSENSVDFIFDSRHMIVEVLPFEADLNQDDRKYPYTVEFDKPGLLVVTSLQRLRHPLVRYLNGDVGSIHKLPSSMASKFKGETQYLQILRLQGRDMRHSFSWQGEYFEFSNIKNTMSNPAWGILRWQIILRTGDLDSNSEHVEVRLMRMNGENGRCLVQDEQIILGLRQFFCADDMEGPLFDVKMVTSFDLFIKSDSGNKVIMFIDKRETKK